MARQTTKLFPTTISSIFLMLTITSQAIFDKTRVTIINDIANESINIHCYSSDNDLGVHDLSYKAKFSWPFRVNFARTTKFYCDFKTEHGSGNYGVYTFNLEARCGNKCDWYVRRDGPCLLQLGGDYYCQAWKNPTEFNLRV